MSEPREFIATFKMGEESGYIMPADNETHGLVNQGVIVEFVMSSDYRKLKAERDEYKARCQELTKALTVICLPKYQDSDTDSLFETVQVGAREVLLKHGVWHGSFRDLISTGEDQE